MFNLSGNALFVVGHNILCDQGVLACKNRGENTGEAKGVRYRSKGSVWAEEAHSAYTSSMAKSHTGASQSKATWWNLRITVGEFYETKFTL